MQTMQHEHYGQLLLDAIRETLETMAFAEVVPHSMKIGDREILCSAEQPVAVNLNTAATQQGGGWGDVPAAVPELEVWGEIPFVQPSILDTTNVWGVGPSTVTDRMWANPLDAWEENVAIPIPEATEAGETKQINFDKLMNEQDDWCWSCLKVNSPELDAIWLIVSKQLAQELARTMYAGDDFQLDSPALRDIIAELTNVFGGQLMLLLEEIIGKFTLEVPVTGIGHPDLPDPDKTETVTCRVFVDGTYPVVSVLAFKDRQHHVNIST